MARGDQLAYGQFYDRTAGAVLGMVPGVIRDRELRLRDALIRVRDGLGAGA